VVSAAELALPRLPSTPPAIDLRYKYGLGGRVLKTTAAPDGTETYTVEIFDSLRLNRTSFDSVAGDYNRSAATESVIIGDIARVVHAPQLPRGPAGNPQHVFLQFSDWLGSSTSVIDKDTSEVVERLTYQAYGGTESDYRPPRWGSNREDFRFSGKEDDFAVGLTFFGARYYHAALGRWASADPLAIHGLAGGLNPYQYVSSSPHNGVDPIGLCTDLGFEQQCGDEDVPPVSVEIPGPIDNPSSPHRGAFGPPGGTPYAPTSPPPPVYPVGSPATGVFDPSAGMSDWNPAKWIMSGTGGFHDFITSDRNWETAQYAVAVTAGTIVSGGIALEAIGGATGVSVAIAEAGAVLRPLVLSAQIGMYKAADILNEISLAEQGISVPRAPVVSPLVARSEQLMGGAWEALGRPPKNFGSIAIGEGPGVIRGIGTNNPKILEWLKESAQLRFGETVAPLVKGGDGKFWHSELAVIDYMMKTGIWRVGSVPLGCQPCQYTMRVLFPFVIHVNPK
jgi:RHS repeat-associated protein